jgi:predicted nucleotidyltransferase
VNTAAPTTTDVDGYCASVRARVTEVFLGRVGVEVSSLSMFGSIAAGGPLWPGSDIDLIVTVPPGAASTGELCRRVADAVTETERAVGLPVSITFGTLPDVCLLWSETVRRALADNTVTLYGTPLSAQLARDPWDWRQVRRGALRLLCFTRRHIVDQYTAVLQGGDPHGDTARRILKSAVNAARFAVWSMTPPDRPLVSRPAEVVPRLAGILPETADVLDAALRGLVRAEPPDAALLAGCVDFVDDLLAVCRQRLADLFRDGDIFIDPV